MHTRMDGSGSWIQTLCDGGVLGSFVLLLLQWHTAPLTFRTDRCLLLLFPVLVTVMAAVPTTDTHDTPTATNWMTTKAAYQTNWMTTKTD